MATTVAELVARLGLDNSNFVSGVDSSLKKFESFGSKMTSIGKTLSLSVSAPLIALGGFAIKAASDAEETASKFAVVFRDVAGDAEMAFSTLRNEYGLSNTAAKELLGNTGDLLTGFGFTQQSALELSTEVNKLAVDLASFTNFSGGAKGASDALTKALLGERESVKALGISILEEDVKKQVAINTAKGLVFETERQAKAQATLDIAIQQSQNAIGDYARTQDSFANQTRLLTARVQDLLVQFGEIMLPIATKLIGVFASLVDRFTNLDTGTKRIIIVFAAFAAAIGPVLVAIGFFATTILPAMITGFTILTGPIGLVIAAIAALAAGVLYIWDNWSAIKERITDIGWWTNILIDMAQFVLKYNPIALLIKPYEYLLGLLGIEIPNPFNLVSDALEGMRKETKEYTHEFGSFGDAVKNAAKAALGSFSQVKDEAKNTTGAIEGTTTAVIGLGTAIKKLSHSPLTAKGMLGFSLTELGQQIKDFKDRVAFEELFDGIKVDKVAEGFSLAFEPLVSQVDFFKGVIGSAQNNLEGLFNTMLNGGSAFDFILNMIKQLIARLAAAAVAALVLSSLLPGLGGVGASIFKSAGGGGFGAIFSMLSGMPRFAKGGMVTGLTTAVLGDNPSGKEAVIPFERMGEFLGKYGGGQMQMQAYTFASGEDLQIVLSNYNARTGRNLG